MADAELRRVEVLRELHEPRDPEGVERLTCGLCLERWPCPTIRALDGAP